MQVEQTESDHHSCRSCTHIGADHAGVGRINFKKDIPVMGNHQMGPEYGK